MRAFSKFLLQPEVPLWKYCLVAYPLAMIPSIIFYALVRGTLAAAGLNVGAISAPDRSTSLGEVLGSVAFAPVAETFLLAGVLSILSLLSSRRMVIAAMSAVIWGALHATLGALWFFGTAWTFFVLSCAYLGWRPISFKFAFVAALVPHVLINSSVMFLLWSLNRAV
jgi:hypothetical protein